MCGEHLILCSSETYCADSSNNRFVSPAGRLAHGVSRHLNLCASCCSCPFSVPSGAPVRAKPAAIAAVVPVPTATRHGNYPKQPEDYVDCTLISRSGNHQILFQHQKDLPRTLVYSFFSWSLIYLPTFVSFIHKCLDTTAFAASQ